MPKYKLIHPQCIYSHIEYLMSLIDLRREIQIRLNLLNLLQLFIFGMMWSLSYKSCSPYVSIVLGILSMTTLAWIGICQQRHIQKLGETITHLGHSGQLCTVVPLSHKFFLISNYLFNKEQDHSKHHNTILSIK